MVRRYTINNKGLPVDALMGEFVDFRTYRDAVAELQAKLDEAKTQLEVAQRRVRSAGNAIWMGR